VLVRPSGCKPDGGTKGVPTGFNSQPRLKQNPKQGGAQLCRNSAFASHTANLADTNLTPSNWQTNFWAITA